MSKPKNPIYKRPFVLVILCLALLIFVRGLPFDYPASTGELAKITGKAAINIEREKHYLRHFRWSGIFPFQGGFYPDPYFYMTPVFEFPPDVLDGIGMQTGRYQGVDVNAGFGDETSEILLVLELDNETFELPIVSVDPKLSDGFMNFWRASMVSFLYGSDLVVLTRLSGLGIQYGLGMLVVSVPIEPKTVITPYFANDPEFVIIAEDLAASGKLARWRRQFCEEGGNSYKKFYNTYSSCDARY